MFVSIAKINLSLAVKTVSHAMGIVDMISGYAYPISTNIRVILFFRPGMIASNLVFDTVMLAWYEYFYFIDSLKGKN